MREQLIWRHRSLASRALSLILVLGPPFNSRLFSHVLRRQLSSLHVTGLCCAHGTSLNSPSKWACTPVPEFLGEEQRACLQVR